MGMFLSFTPTPLKIYYPHHPFPSSVSFFFWCDLLEISALNDSRKVLRRLQRSFESLDSEIFVEIVPGYLSAPRGLPDFVLSFRLPPYSRPPSSNSSRPLGDSLIKIYSSSSQLLENPRRPIPISSSTYKLR
ncbi:uncharacterized protein H6S33_007461 [Morchella sextelata]|uniref:uncharacterized protein n=1 Tax=Morchella sextelata TaxID=1174677 RepID=UPI001D05BEF4|nr:uncharacterized protein H6S33_007461 [Morchella sextelata]KAH0603802.1 hypothetical protein H6S33_007461 [Morchella sextelata]